MPDLRSPPKFPPKAREDGREPAAQSGSVSVVPRTGKKASAAGRGCRVLVWFVPGRPEWAPRRNEGEAEVAGATDHLREWAAW